MIMIIDNFNNSIVSNIFYSQDKSDHFYSSKKILQGSINFESRYFKDSFNSCNHSDIREHCAKYSQYRVTIKLFLSSFHALFLQFIIFNYHFIVLILIFILFLLLLIISSYVFVSSKEFFSSFFVKLFETRSKLDRTEFQANIKYFSIVGEISRGRCYA